MKVLRSLTIGFIFYLLYGLFISHYNLNVFEPTLKRIHPPGFYDYSGVLNVHTDKSGGSESFTEVIKAAQDVGLDFVFISDLNDFAPQKERERYWEQLLVLVDSEFGFLDSRLLIYGQRDYSHFKNFGQTQAILNDRINRPRTAPTEGLVVLSHPTKKGFQWSGEIPDGIDGLEVVNLKSVWQQAWNENKLSFLWSLLIYPFNPELALIRLFPFPNAELTLWDKLNTRRYTLGFAGADAEGKIKTPFANIKKIPSYQNLFNIVRTHVLLPSELTGNSQEDREKIVSALSGGNFYFSLDKLANPQGFNTTVKDTSSGKVYLMGSKLRWKKDLRLQVQFQSRPLYPFDIVIYKDGERVLSSDSADTRYMIQGPGVYRVLVRIIPTLPLPDGKKWVPWIFTNAFYVGSES